MAKDFNPFIFIRRLGRCKGFGIQSPSDFAFVNEVVYERSPYYAYEPLRERYPDTRWWEHKLLRLLLRVSNYAQPSHIKTIDSTPVMVTDYLYAGCSRSNSGNTLYYNMMPERFADNDCIIISDIYGNGAEQWEILKDKRHTSHLILFDLYYIGIAFVRERRYPELHTVNLY